MPNVQPLHRARSQPLPQSPGRAGTQEVHIPVGGTWLHGDLTLPSPMSGLVLFAHGSGSGRHSPRNRQVAESLHQAGLARGLQFELFKPGQERIGEFYAELPIEIRLVGSFHALAGFVSDVTHLRRIVSIDRVAIARQPGGQLSFECVAHAYRYLEPAEVAARKEQAVEARKKGQR